MTKEGLGRRFKSRDIWSKPVPASEQVSQQQKVAWVVNREGVSERRFGRRIQSFDYLKLQNY